MSITTCLSSQINLHETLTHKSYVSLSFNPISGFPINKHTIALAPLTTTNIAASRWESMIAYANVEPAGTPSPPPTPPSGSWKNWAIGILMTVAVPSVTTKGGPIKLLLQKVDHIVDTAEHISDIVESVADKVDKVVEELEDDLPENSQIKKTLDYIEQVAERVEKDAHTAGDFIDKFQEMQEKIEDLMEPVLEEAREVAKETKEREKHKNNDID
ncbi:uncharacterized protein LOC111910770 [Lactuca sativa]|uniref:Uncharacterized protein n=1 Tax=Lactuca sativa TaxID=4236 RepID=A0A9R1XXL0_LACSA|nr:uncharacterized protein LOC111910770 [Lactuca sativa]KAJ0227569.1 hypothetical protein LSAT_V11C100001420 [Lactuca sativa]